MFLPFRGEIREISERGLEGSQNRRKPDFPAERFFGVLRPRDDFGKIAKLLGLQDNFSARIRANRTDECFSGLVKIPALLPKRRRAALRQDFSENATVENPPLSRTAFHKREPLAHKLRARRFLTVHR